jgi:hypothetical protein
MAWRERLRDPLERTRLISFSLLLGVFASLPSPLEFSQFPHQIWMMGSLWITVASLLWLQWAQSSYIGFVWFLSLILSFTVWRITGWGLSFVLLTLWYVWKTVRFKQHKKLLFGFSLLLVADIYAADQKAVVRPKELSGYQIRDLVSCAAVDRIPWRFAKGNRRTRLVLRDQLRLSTDDREGFWEIFQIMDKNGYVTFAFQRIENVSPVETIAIRDNRFERYVHKNGRRIIRETQDVRTLINRMVVTLYHASGASVSFAPGLAGDSTLTIDLSENGNRPLAPVFLRGNYCGRPKDDSNSMPSPGAAPQTADNNSTGGAAASTSTPSVSSSGGN